MVRAGLQLGISIFQLRPTNHLATLSICYFEFKFQRSLTSKNKDGELFTLDAIRSGIRFQKSVAEGWVKVRLLCLVEIHPIGNLYRISSVAGGILLVRDISSQDLLHYVLAAS